METHCFFILNPCLSFEKHRFFIKKQCFSLEKHSFPMPQRQIPNLYRVQLRGQENVEHYGQVRRMRLPRLTPWFTPPPKPRKHLDTAGNRSYQLCQGPIRSGGAFAKSPPLVLNSLGGGKTRVPHTPGIFIQKDPIELWACE